MSHFVDVPAALEEIRKQKFLIVVDDEDRENEGDFFIPADFITPEGINFLAIHGRGLICTPLTENRAKELSLPPMVQDNTSHLYTAFTVSVDSIKCQTGISATDRYVTIRDLVDVNTRISDLMRPGHIFPLIAKEGGVLERDGHTEASIDLCRLAGCNPLGVICEIMNEDGSMARISDLEIIAEKFDLKILTIKSLKEFLSKQLNSKAGIINTTDLPTEYGNFKLHLFSNISGEPHIALTKGSLGPDSEPLVRIHSECLTGDVFSSKRCDCGDQLNKSLQLIGEQENGVLIYLRQEGRGIGLIHKIEAYNLQDLGLDTVDANLKLGFPEDARTYQEASLILKHFGVEKIRLITNNPSKMEQLSQNGIEIMKRVSLNLKMNPFNTQYLKTKKDRMGHILDPQIQ